MIGDGNDRNDGGGRRFQAESGNDLRLAVVEELKIFLFQIVHDFAVLVADNHANQHYVYADFEGGGGGASDDFRARGRRRGSVGRLGWLRWGIVRRGRRLREKRPGEKQSQQRQQREASEAGRKRSS